MYYQFKQEDAFRFASDIGIQTYQKGSELHFKQCPYCKGTTRDKKTFSINLVTGQFKCLRDSCGATGNMVILSKDFNFSLGADVDAYYKQQTKYRALKQPKEKIVPKAPAIQFLESRGISKEIAERYEITTQKDRDNVLVFPFYDEKAVLQFVKYRKTDFDKEKDSCKEWCEKDCKPILFGMKQCEKDNYNYLVITEGQMDSLAVAESYEYGVNVVSVPTGSKGFTFMPNCYDWLVKFKEIIIFGDYEKEHISLFDEFNRRFPGKVKHVREEDYKDCKDANEILLKYGKEQVGECIANAVYPPVKKVLSISDVQHVEVQKFRCGINEVDDLLLGGLPFGYLTLLTGVRGQGKSTLGEQIIAYALDQNYNCFIYSGELTNSNAKEWLDRQLAGEEVVSEVLKSGYSRYYVRNSTLEKLNKWYADRCYIYDNTCVYDEEENLLKTLEEVISKYNVKVVLLDNLMTAIDSFDSRDDKYEKQSKFTKAVTRIAQQYEVAIILVAHKRKHGANAVDGANENDEVSGSADITNLAGIVIAYGENKDEATMNEYPSKVKVLKNRLTGRTNYDGINVKFDEKTKRIYGDKDDKYHKFGWNESGFYEVDETPFDEWE